MSRIFIPSSGPGDWRCLLADPVKHWARGKSARTLAHCWEDTNGFPPEIEEVLNQSEDLEDAEPLLIFPEWKVPLVGGVTASQNDVWVLAKNQKGLISIAIEGKVDESFDKLLGEWKKDLSTGKKKRLSYLASILGLEESAITDSTYYQLLHRTASAVIEAEKYQASSAVMLVHTFSPQDQWFKEFSDFVALYGVEIKINQLATVAAKDGMPLHLGWVHGNERYLAA